MSSCCTCACCVTANVVELARTLHSAPSAQTPQQQQEQQQIIQQATRIHRQQGSRIIVSHALKLRDSIDALCEEWFSVGKSSASNNDNKYNQLPLDVARLATLLAMHLLSSAQLLDVLRYSRLIFFSRSLPWTNEHHLSHEDGIDLQPSHASAAQSSNKHSTMFCFDRPTSIDIALLGATDWLLILIPAFQCVTSCGTFLRARSCCFTAFADSLGVACFLGLRSAVERNSTTVAANNGESISDEVFRKGHIFFFGLHQWQLCRFDSSTDHESLRRTLSLTSDANSDLVVQAVRRNWNKRSLRDHALLTLLLVRYFARCGGISESDIDSVVATLDKQSMNLCGLDVELYQLKVPSSVHRRLGVAAFDDDAAAVDDDERSNNSDDKNDSSCYFTYFVDFSRLGLCFEDDDQQQLEHQQQQQQQRRHEYARFKNSWLDAVVRSSGKVNNTGANCAGICTLFFDVDTPMDGKVDSRPFVAYRAYRRTKSATNAAVSLKQEHRWSPCMLKLRSLSRIGRGLDFAGWAEEAQRLVDGLFGTVSWAQRLAIAKRATYSLAELVAAMSDEECRQCGFTTVNASSSSSSSSSMAKMTMTEMPNVMWQIRFPPAAAALANVLGIRLHVFENAAETVPHNHGIPFFSSIIRGGYVQTLWREVSKEEELQILAKQQQQQQQSQANKKKPGAMPLPSQTLRTTSGATVHDAARFLPVVRPFAAGAKARVKADEHGEHSSAAQQQQQQQQRNAATNDDGIVVRDPVILQQTFVHTHRAGSVYFVSSKEIHTVDTSDVLLMMAPPHSPQSPSTPSSEQQQQPQPQRKERTITFVIRTPTHWSAEDAAVFYVAEKNCCCSASNGNRNNDDDGANPGAAVAMEHAAAAAVRGTFGISREGSEAAAQVMRECRKACQDFCMSIL